MDSMEKKKGICFASSCITGGVLREIMTPIPSTPAQCDHTLPAHPNLLHVFSDFFPDPCLGHLILVKYKITLFLRTRYWIFLLDVPIVHPFINNFHIVPMHYHLISPNYRGKPPDGEAGFVLEAPGLNPVYFLGIITRGCDRKGIWCKTLAKSVCTQLWSGGGGGFFSDNSWGGV